VHYGICGLTYYYRANEYHGIKLHIGTNDATKATYDRNAIKLAVFPLKFSNQLEIRCLTGNKKGKNQ
jgi:hypothetical protein